MPALGAEAGENTASVRYHLGSDFAGTVNGSCDATLLMLPNGGGSVTLDASGGAWLRERANFTYVHLNSDQGTILRTTWLNLSQEESPIPEGPLRIDWRPGGRADAYPAPGPLGRASSPAPATFQGSAFAAGKVLGAVETARLYDEWNGIPVQGRFSIQGPNRAVTVQGGNLTLEGDITFFLEDATVTVADGTQRTVPPRHENGTITGFPESASAGNRYENWAFLTLQAAHVAAPSKGATLYCQGLQARLDGSLNAYFAEGTVERGPESISFEERELTLEGAFDWSEEPGERAVTAQAAGEFHAVSLDFDAVEEIEASGWNPILTAGLWATVLGALGAAGWYAKGLFPFFSRLKDDALAGHPARRAILEAVRANPDVNLRTLVSLTGLEKSTVRYHARVLETRGLIHSRRVGRDRCFIAKQNGAKPNAQTQDLPRDLLLRNDVVVGHLMRTLGPQGARLNPVLVRLSADLGISRPGAWKAVVRAEQYGLVRRERQGREVWVSCVP